MNPEAEAYTIIEIYDEEKDVQTVYLDAGINEATGEYLNEVTKYLNKEGFNVKFEFFYDEMLKQDVVAAHITKE